MAGIVSYGAYLPRTRLPFALVAGRPAKEGGPERTVAWNDEDALTMAVAASASCLRGLDRSSVDGVLFASTTHPFREKQGAALLARVLDLPREVRTADYSGSLRAGLQALRGAIDAVAAGSSRRVLVVASDCRLAAPGSGLETKLGDGAAAFLVGDVDCVASFETAYAVADEIVDVWRAEGDRFVHSWEDRFVLQEGYAPREKPAHGLDDARSHGEVCRTLRIPAERVQDPLFGRVGDAGTAFAPLLLAASLETLRPGERVIVAGYGDGAEALSFQASAQIEKLEPRRGVSWHLARRRAAKSYDRYLKARGLQTREYEPPRDQGLSATVHHRERDEDLSFCGQRCRRCNAVQFPMQRVCETCFAKDDFERVRLADRVGKLVTYTFDFFFPTTDPPTIVTVTEVEGARVHIQLINVSPEDVKLDMPVEFSFRRIHESGGSPN
ncbi:MAG: hydroxymethylglutaryl-CoA synthase family protein [Myxococcales bacterium]|nr:MAG: hydroxymethylglutaryl-CoA synthase family protein [Myxococcales bacterium]